MADRWAGGDHSIIGPVSSCADVTAQKSDTVNLTTTTRAVSVGTDGNIAVILANDTAAVTIAVLAGVVYPFRVKRLMSTNTTATVIIGYT